MKLPPASKLNKIKPKIKVDRTMTVVVNDFLDGELFDAIVEAVQNNENGVNIEVPNDAYRDLETFYSIAISKLKKLGYDAISSHDGAGMYNTIGVSWKKKN